MIGVTTSGSFKKTDAYLKRLAADNVFRRLDTLAQKGTQALIDATPKDSGLTANSWRHRVSRTKDGWKVDWYNVREEDGIPIAILIQYGHATGTGGYVEGRDYINPAIQPILDQISKEVWEEAVRT